MAGEGVISQNDLMRKLVTAKKVMDKVETGSFEPSRHNEQVSRMTADVMNEQEYSTPKLQVVDRDKINGTKLPDSIKRAMIESPIQQPNISLTDTLDMDFVKGAKRLMEQDGVSIKQNKNTPVVQTRTSYVPSITPSNTVSEIISQLTPIIENTIRKVLDEKLNQILTAQTTSTINENLVLKVGDSIFKGRITGVNKAK